MEEKNTCLVLTLKENFGKKHSLMDANTSLTWLYLFINHKPSNLDYS